MAIFKNKKIGVLLGGLSSEREVSLRSGKAVAEGLRKKGYSVVEIDADTTLPEKLKAEGVEVAFIALHGNYGEDGAVQGLLEIMRIPYTGSGILASSVAMDKILTKRILGERGFLTPAYAYFESNRMTAKEFARTFSLSFPVIVKPSREGSTIGITRVQEIGELEKALLAAEEYDSRVLVEEFITGKEVTSGVLAGEPLPLIEVVPKSGFYDFQSKYTKGATEYILPARISPELTQEIQSLTVEIFNELGCEGVVRADYMIDSEDRPYFLEINTIPGMTETSLIPKAAAQAGISFEDLVEKMLDSARLKTSLRCK
ncbi:MAG: D-alanine--D-alanine ligase [bacterium]